MGFFGAELISIRAYAPFLPKIPIIARRYADRKAVEADRRKQPEESPF
jgi:hypothetical protein